MLWHVIKPEASSLYWLDEVHKGFYENVFDGQDFDACFPQEFGIVLDASDKTKELFQTVFDVYADLGEADKVTFQAIYNQQLGIYAALSDTGVELLKPNISPPGTLEHKAVWKACKKLGGYLYSTTLGLGCLSAALLEKYAGGIVLSSMHAHYQKFKELNGEVCSFCGLENMVSEVLVVPDGGAQLEEERQRRASYDHYLPKKHYPFLAVDFNNLIPCCDVCNEDYKEEKDVLENDGHRVLAFNPYFDEQVVLEASYKNQVGDFYRMSVGVKNTGCELELKTKTWGRVFKVVGRVNYILSKSFDEEWAAPILYGVHDVEEARQRLQCEALRYQPKFKLSKESFFKSLCYRTLCESDGDELPLIIESVKEIYSARAQAL